MKPDPADQPKKGDYVCAVLDGNYFYGELKDIYKIPRPEEDEPEGSPQ